MSKIYGFGNALVDIEIQIDEGQLISIGIPKGSMKHIDLEEKEELLKKLHTLPNRPKLIPYRTSYYKRDWGFCISHNQKKQLIKGNYEVFIDTKLFRGKMNYGEIVLMGKIKKNY